MLAIRCWNRWVLVGYLLAPMNKQRDLVFPPNRKSSESCSFLRFLLPIYEVRLEV